jgi:hypothetical protein
MSVDAVCASRRIRPVSPIRIAGSQRDSTRGKCGKQHIACLSDGGAAAARDGHPAFMVQFTRAFRIAAGVLVSIGLATSSTASGRPASGPSQLCTHTLLIAHARGVWITPCATNRPRPVSHTDPLVRPPVGAGRPAATD